MSTENQQTPDAQIVGNVPVVNASTGFRTDITSVQPVRQASDTETTTATKPDDWKALAAKWEEEAKKTAADADKWKAMSRKHEDRAKENAGAAASAKTLEERLAELEQHKADAEARATRAEVAGEKGLPAKLARYLQGSTREELEASADELVAELKPKADAQVGQPTRPKERLRSGAVPDADNEPDYEAIASEALKRPVYGRK